MFERLGAAVVRHPWRVMIGWAVIGVALTLFAQARIFEVTTSDQKDLLTKSSESVQGAELAERAFGKPEGTTSLTGLVKRSNGDQLTRNDMSTVNELTAGMPRFRPDWDEIGSKMPWLTDSRKEARVVEAAASPGIGRAPALVSLEFKGNPADPATQEAFTDFRDATVASFAQRGLQIGFTGGLAQTVDLAEESKGSKILEQAVLYGGVVLLTFLFFRGILVAILPLLAVILVGGAATGLIVLAAMASGFELESSTPTLITVVLIGIGIDYFLFLLFRYRERLRAGDERRPAVVNAVGKVGAVIASAALAVVVAFATLGLAEFGQFQMLGPAIAISVAVMLVAGLTLFPAILAVSGRAMFWPSKSWRRPDRPGFAARLGKMIARRPGATALASTSILVVLAIGALGGKIVFDVGGAETDTQSARVEDEIAATLPRGAIQPVEVYVRGDHPLSTEALAPLTKRLGTIDGVGSVGAPKFAADRRVAQLDVALEVESDSDQAMAIVRGPLRTAAPASAPPGTDVLVGGTPAVYADVDDSVSRDLRLIFPVAAALILLILIALVRSVVAPAYLLVAVGLEFVATFGAVVLLFQEGLGREGVAFSLPIVLYLFVVALGTDYNMLIASRLREESQAGHSGEAGTATAVRYAFPAIAAAGIVLATSFGSLMFSPEESLRQMGFSMAVGILIASFIVSGFLVPAVTRLVGDRAWWPGVRRRSAKRVQGVVARPRASESSG
jgi:RND superfamily putative drug exporter